MRPQAQIFKHCRIERARTTQIHEHPCQYAVFTCAIMYLRIIVSAKFKKPLDYLYKSLKMWYVLTCIETTLPPNKVKAFTPTATLRSVPAPRSKIHLHFVDVVGFVVAICEEIRRLQVSSGKMSHFKISALIALQICKSLDHKPCILKSQPQRQFNLCHSPMTGSWTHRNQKTNITPILPEAPATSNSPATVHQSA